jgi:flagellar motility protein MotE (MotC chaperone)
MTKLLREFRLIPIVLVAIGCLFALKSLGLVLDGGYTLGQRFGGGGKLIVTTVPASPSVELRSPSIPLNAPAAQQSGSKPSWMQEMFNYRDATGSVPAAKPAPKDAAKESAGKEPAGPTPAAKNGPAAAQEPPATVDGKVIAMDQSRPSSPAERALLDRLQERRQELDARKRELDVRESLLKAAEKKFDTQNSSQKADDAKGGGPGQRRDDADTARMKALVTMYETMKPKDAARIFDRLDSKVLLDIVRLINPRQMSEILAQMAPEAAERLTVELAARGDDAEKPMNPAALPKIVGKPPGG